MIASTSARALSRAVKPSTRSLPRNVSLQSGSSRSLSTPFDPTSSALLQHTQPRAIATPIMIGAGLVTAGLIANLLLNPRTVAGPSGGKWIKAASTQRWTRRRLRRSSDCARPHSQRPKASERSRSILALFGTKQKGGEGGGGIRGGKGKGGKSPTAKHGLVRRGAHGQTLEMLHEHLQRHIVGKDGGAAAARRAVHAAAHVRRARVELAEQEARLRSVLVAHNVARDGKRSRQQILRVRLGILEHLLEVLVPLLVLVSGLSPLRHRLAVEYEDVEERVEQQHHVRPDRHRVEQHGCGGPSKPRSTSGLSSISALNTAMRAMSTAGRLLVERGGDLARTALGKVACDRRDAQTVLARGVLVVRDKLDQAARAGLHGLTGAA
ncbi:hypothetical protein L1887_61063 [Cichorium endivia]|nr:hypothetical protein L1887_61063 [Cichorium endivia]